MSKRILVIDDEPRIQEAIRITLEMMVGWQVISAASGAEGISRAAAEHPDAILLDLMMGDMDGQTTFEQLRSHPQTQDLPVILLTAKLHSGDQKHFVQQGLKAVIPKPFDPLTLAQQISQALGWPPDT